MAIKKISAENANKQKGKTNWEELDSLTDKEIEEAVKSDPDSALPSEDELKNFKPVSKKEEK